MKAVATRQAERPLVRVAPVQKRHQSNVSTASSITKASHLPLFSLQKCLDAPGIASSSHTGKVVPIAARSPHIPHSADITWSVPLQESARVRTTAAVQPSRPAAAIATPQSIFFTCKMIVPRTFDVRHPTVYTSKLPWSGGDD